MKQLLQYMAERFGLPAKADLLSKKKKSALPLFLQGNFELYDGYISAVPVIWAKPLKDTDLSPSQLKKQAASLKSALGSPIIFVFDHLDAWQRKRLIERHIAFVQPPKQLYIPELLLELNDTITKKSGPIAQENYLNPPSQLALLYHIQVASLANLSFGEIARLLRLSAMSITRIAKELQSTHLAEVTGNKEKFLSFPFGGRALWDKALPFLQSPVRQTGFISKDLPRDVFRIGGEPALAHYTLLAENGQPSYCIGKEAFLTLRQTDKLTLLAGKYGDHKIEVWHYDPTLLSQREEVDRLSLYLTLAQEKDERVMGALNDLINEMQW
jgi:hypothetical protein